MMKKYIMLSANKIGQQEKIEIADSEDINVKYHPTILARIVPVSLWPKDNQIYNGTKFVDPPAPTTEELKKQAEAELAQVNTRLSMTVGDVVSSIISKNIIMETDIDTSIVQMLKRRNELKLILEG